MLIDEVVRSKALAEQHVAIEVHDERRVRHQVGTRDITKNVRTVAVNEAHEATHVLGKSLEHITEELAICRWDA